MADQRFASPPSGTTGVGTTSCPPVGDLITYALGQLTGDARRHVESHLQAGGCRHCRGWVEKAARTNNEMHMDLSDKPPPSLPAAARRGPLSPPSAAFTPLPANAKWRREAFRELERRLRQLEEQYEK